MYLKVIHYHQPPIENVMNASFTARELWQFCLIIFREYLVEINFILFYSSRCYRKEEHNDKRFFSYPCELFIVLLFKYIDKSSYCLFSILFFHVGIPNVRNINELTVYRTHYFAKNCVSSSSVSNDATWLYQFYLFLENFLIFSSVSLLNASLVCCKQFVAICHINRSSRSSF